MPLIDGVHGLISVSVNVSCFILFFDCRKQIGSMKPHLPSNPHPTDAPRSRNIRFSKMLSSDSEGSCKHEKDFDCFTVREAMLDEEYWVSFIFQLSWSCSRYPNPFCISVFNNLR